MSVVTKFVHQGSSDAANRSVDLRAVNCFAEVLSSEYSDSKG